MGIDFSPLVRLIQVVGILLLIFLPLGLWKLVDLVIVVAHAF